MEEGAPSFEQASASGRASGTPAAGMGPGVIGDRTAGQGKAWNGKLSQL